MGTTKRDKRVRRKTAACSQTAQVGLCAFGHGCTWNHGNAHCHGYKCFCDPGNCTSDLWTCKNPDALELVSEMSDIGIQSSWWQHGEFLVLLLFVVLVASIIGATFSVGASRMANVLREPRRKVIGEPLLQ